MTHFLVQISVSGLFVSFLFTGTGCRMKSVHLGTWLIEIFGHLFSASLFARFKGHRDQTAAKPQAMCASRRLFYLDSICDLIIYLHKLI